MQQMIGASGFTRRVARHHADVLGAEDVDEGEELLAHQRLDRRGVERALPLGEAAACAATATSDLPVPVGVERMTFAPETISMSASSCAGYSGNPRDSAHSTKTP